MSTPQFIAESFAVRTAAHLLHLSATTYASHIALGEFYDAVTDLIDKYAEVYMGTHGQVKDWPVCPLPTVKGVDLLTIFNDMVLDEQKTMKNNQALLNILAEMQELTSQTLYKLKFLK